MLGLFKQIDDNSIHILYLSIMSDLFNEKAQEWDKNEMVRLLSEAVGAAITNTIHFSNNMQVMDFGAGTGLISEHVAPLVHSITAVDVSQAMLDKLIAKPGLRGKVNAICQDITDTPLHESFNVIISAMALHHVKDTHKLLKSFAEHLLPGGQIALADLDKEDGTFHPEDVQGVFHHGFEREALQQLLETTGFTDVNFTTAHIVKRDNNEFPIFLVTACKH